MWKPENTGGIKTPKPWKSETPESEKYANLQMQNIRKCRGRKVGNDESGLEEI